jgi:hypothetical protein
MDVFVLTVNHRHGTDLGVYTTENGAYAALVKYCRDSWDEVREYDDTLSETLPEEDAIIELYFDVMQDSESYDIRSCLLED